MAASVQAAGEASHRPLVEGGVVDDINPAGQGRVLLVCEHASNTIPPVFADLGLGPDLRESHIAWDPGALPVAKALSAALDARLIAQRVSRLVYDCNRPPQADSAIPEISEIHEIPGNRGLTEAERRARVEQVYEPFRRAVAEALDARQEGDSVPVLVTVHSFTPVYEGRRRAVDVGILCDADSRLAEALLAVTARRTDDLAVRLNEPYGPADGVTHTLVEQALPRGLLNVMIEIRNDLIADAPAQQAMGDWLADCIGQALGELGAPAAGAGPRRSIG
ncbi:N-formylglutamate amidohydrolase [Pelagibius sp.]|uniref:N-formylglutamate amidohydrolase n=1 Tax=Pelagibius sp. TaxID=1931238 RepID=UPI002AC35F9F|nr:N-formylglutamate amidohydrolase [Pelagibius sp.]